MFSFQDVVNAAKDAAKARLAVLAGEAPAELTKLTSEAATFLETNVAPKFDIPPVVVQIAQTQNANIETAAVNFEEQELNMLVGRLTAIL